MNDLDPLYVWRLINAFLAFGAFAMALFIGMKPVFHLVGPRTKMMMLAMLLMLLRDTYGSIEQALHNVEFGWRILMTTVSMIWIWLAMLFMTDDVPWDGVDRRGSDDA